MVGPAVPPARIVVTLTREDAGERIDRVLARRVPGPTRAAIKRWIDAGRVTLDGAAVKASSAGFAGGRVEIEPEPSPPPSALPEDIPIAVLYEDEDLLVVDKPPGLVVHPAAGHWSGTLVNALLHRARLDTDEPRTAGRPGIVHRLDKDTSGVMVVAKTERARLSLVEQLSAHTVSRAYLAIVLGAPRGPVTYDTLHGRHARDRKRFTTRVGSGKRAVTHVRVVELLAGGKAALVEARLETGRTHQVRVHLAEHGFPLLGDPVYGRKSQDPLLRDVGETLARQALHAALLGFRHPTSGEAVEWRSDPPADFARALRALRAARSP